MAKKNKGAQDPFEELKRIQRLILTAIASDDSLMERLFLKGGTAIDLIHGIGERHSVDLDFSMAGDFTATEKLELRDRLERLLTETFRSEGLTVLDVKFEPKPRTIAAKLDQFWGGYRLEFKLIETAKAERIGKDPERLSREALRVGPSDSSKFEVEISRFEYCGDTEPKSIDGFTINVYRPRLLACEKLRAICQQLPEYEAVIEARTGRPRARDFFDIYNLVHHFNIDVSSPEFLEVLTAVFAAKHVPLDWLDKIRDVRRFHEDNFQHVKETVTAGTRVYEFETYFNFVVEIADKLKALRNV